MDLIFHLLLEHKRNKTYKRYTANSSGAKFNMKHSLKSLDLQRSWRSPTEQTDRWGPHTGSLHQHHPLQHFSSIQQLSSPAPATRFPQNGFTLGSVALSHSALCTIFQTVIKYVTTHKFKPFLNNDAVSISSGKKHVWNVLINIIFSGKTDHIFAWTKKAFLPAPLKLSRWHFIYFTLLSLLASQYLLHDFKKKTLFSFLTYC